MAISPVKRSRRVVEDEQQSEIAGPSSAVKRVKVEHTEPRRRQLSDTPLVHSQNGNINDDDDAEEEDDDDTESESEEAALERLAFPDDAANLKAYEAVKEKQNKRMGSKAEAGVIKTVTLVDFMNHKHTTVDFSGRMNFLVGHNGSGKSAILTAIAVAMGGKAATTGRGSGIKDLIRKGADKAIITLTLANAGSEAYRPDIYSPHIVIERTLDRNGSSGYKFRAVRDGKTLTNKREELHHICEYFNITIDSPLTILTQDAARSFLQNANDHTLYQFFLEGTQLRNLANSYDKTLTSISQIEGIIKAQRSQIPDYRAKVERLARQLKASEKITELEDKMKLLWRQLAWSYVIDKENSLDATHKVLDEQREKLTMIEQKLKECGDEWRPNEDQLKELEKELREYETSRQPLERAKAKAQTKLVESRKMLRDHEGDLENAQAAIRDRNAEIAQLQQAIEAKEQANNAAEDPRQVEIRKSIESHEQLHLKLKRDEPLKEMKVQEKEKEFQRAESEEESIEQTYSDAVQKVNFSNNTLRNLERQTTNRLSAFGTNLEGVLDDINRTKWVHSKPIGPLGMHVQLENDKYKRAITAYLGPMMCSFAARCKADQTTLIGILKRRFERGGYRPGTSNPNVLPPVILHAGDRFDFSSGDLRRHGDTVVSQLKIDNEDVLRILIVGRKIEKQFLALDSRDANREIDRLHRAGIPEPHILTNDLFLQSGSQHSRSSTPMDSWRGNELFIKDVAQSLAALRHELADQTKMQNKLREQLSRATEFKNQAKRDMAEAKRALEQVKKGIPSTQHKIDRLEDQLEDRTDHDIGALALSKKSAQNDIDFHEDQLEFLNTDVLKTKEIIQKLAAEVADLDRRLDEFIPGKEKRTAAIQALVEKRVQTQNSLTHWERGKKTTENKIADHLAAIEIMENEHTDWKARAEAVGERVESRRTSAQLKAERAAAEQAVNAAKQKGGKTKEQLEPEFDEAERRLNEAIEQVQSLGDLSTALNGLVKYRKKWWMEIRAHTAMRARTLFIVYLNKRGFEGRLQIDHEHERLSVLIQTTGIRNPETQDTATQSRFKVPRNLSGGERSYSTIALLLAMWDTAACPFRCLDEWDVFLDSVNRALAGSMLVAGARESEGKQFILITPQDMSNVPTGPDTKITRLGDPERGQGTLDFAAV